MEWTTNEVLLNQRPTQPSKEIFQAVCDEIGEYFVNHGFKYSRSRPKISIAKGKIKLQITFYSSRSNTSGRSINLEILPNFYCPDLKSNSKISGFLFGHTAIFTEPYTADLIKQRVIQIYGEQLELENQYAYESIIKYNHNCNVWDIDETKFQRIIQFIKERIIPWVDVIQTETGIVEMLRNPTAQRLSSISGKSTNSDFRLYCNKHFPILQIDNLIDRKILERRK